MRFYIPLKKIGYLFLFFALFGINLTLIGLYAGKTYKIAEQRKIFDEIANRTNDSSKQFSLSSAPMVLGTSIESDVKIGDGRSANLRYFFRKFNSPLYDFAEDMVSISDKYGFDYRLLAAIAMQESGLCRIIPENSHNCWGYGIYGDQVLRFDSYPEAMETVAQGLKKNYIDKGLITPESIMSKYTPSSNGSWAHGVNWTLKELQ